jgi:hypothetical protein
MKQIIIVAALLMAASTAFAEEPYWRGGVEEFRHFVVTNIKSRLAINNAELSCVNAARNHREIQDCRDQYGRDMKREDLREEAARKELEREEHRRER